MGVVRRLHVKEKKEWRTVVYVEILNCKIFRFIQLQLVLRFIFA